MKVVHVTWTLKFGGIETMLVNIANHQAESGTDVTVIVLNQEYEPSLTSKLSKKVNLIINSRAHASKNPKLINWVNTQLENLQPDIIHTHSSKAIGLFKPKWRQRSVTTLHALPFGSFYNTKLPKFLTKNFPVLNIWGKTGNLGNMNLYPQVFAISNSVKKGLEQYGIQSEVIYNGIPTSKFKLRELRQPNGLFKIVQVGRLECVNKGQDVLLDALSLLPKNITVDFIGDGPDMEALRQKAEQYGLNGRIKWFGGQPPQFIAERLKDYDLFVQPSRLEGFGLTVAEAMCAQLPVLVSSGQGPEEVTQGDRYGWTFVNGDADSLAKEIKNIQNHYNQALDKALAARDYVVNAFDVATTATNYLNAYNKILAFTLLNK